MRPIWTGGISFSLIYIPVKLYSAVQPVQLDLDYLSKKEKAPIRYARIDTKTGKEVAWKDIVKGFQYKEGDYVILEQEDFEAAAKKKSDTIEIEYFVHADEIDHKLFERPYYLEPDKGAKKTYALFQKALEQSGKVGVAEFVMRNREHLVVLTPEKDGLVLNTLRYADEIRSPKELEIPKSTSVDKKQLKTATELIDKMTEKFDPSDFVDDYIKDLKKVIEKKAKNKKFAHVEKKEATPKATDVSEIMDKLKESLKDVQVTK